MRKGMNGMELKNGYESTQTERARDFSGWKHISIFNHLEVSKQKE